MLAVAVASEVAVPGWFGKLACLGDFASRRLPTAFVRACDAWLSQGLAASRAQLGDRWLETYLTSPLWRFAWAPGVVDGAWWFGVMMPSVDNVGRYFPLLVAQPLDEPAPAATLEGWYADVSQATLETLQPGATLERFDGALQAAAQSALSAEPAPVVCEALAMLAADDAAQRLHGRSLWWPLRSRGGESRLTVAMGLPTAASFAELLQGAW
jgi:type VI secretion system protein ImpM